jgi:hypothetical protein
MLRRRGRAQSDSTTGAAEEVRVLPGGTLKEAAQLAGLVQLPDLVGAAHPAKSCGRENPRPPAASSPWSSGARCPCRRSTHPRRRRSHATRQVKRFGDPFILISPPWVSKDEGGEGTVDQAARGRSSGRATAYSVVAGGNGDGGEVVDCLRDLMA